MRKYFALSIICAVIGLLEPPATVRAQVTTDFIALKRGQMWETVNIAKIGPVFQNWSRKGYGMDYPGFDPEYIPREIGGANSHHLGGGFWLGAERPASQDSIWAVVDWAMFATSVGTSVINSPYLLKKHTLRWPDGENYWMQTDANEAEEVVDTEYEFNPRYEYPYTPARFLPVRVKRTVRTWSGSKTDEKYIIIEYVIKNISREAHIFDPDIATKENYRILQADSVLKNLTMMFAYSFSINNRAWNVLFPQYGNGAQNNRFIFDASRRMVYGWADDFSREVGNQKFGPKQYITGGPPSGKEWLAPSYAGIQFLNISPNNSGIANRVNQVGWSVSEPASSYPLTGLESTRQHFDALSDFSMIYQSIIFPQGLNDPRWNQSRLWTLASLGPWDLAPGDSVKIVMSELVGSLDYQLAFESNTKESDIASKGVADINRNAARAQFNYDHNYNVPDPPAAPASFDLIHLAGKQIGNVLSWDDTPETIADPDYSGAEAFDLAGYRVYRSQYLPFGGYKQIADIPKGDSKYYDAVSGNYSFTDTTVNVGFGYYYAVSSYDSGHVSWPPDLSARFPETGSNAVPPMESSYYPNHTTQPFIAAYPSVNSTLDNVLVVPNPFVRSSGITTEGAQDMISFLHTPSPCTLRIYTLTGDLVQVIEHTEDIGVIQWDQISRYGQFAKSGVYLFHITSHAAGTNGKTITGKFAIIR